jgi:hypothetical protein
MRVPRQIPRDPFTDLSAKELVTLRVQALCDEHGVRELVDIRRRGIAKLRVLCWCKAEAQVHA